MFNSMNLQQKLIELAPYHITCEVIEGNLLVGIGFDNQWKIITPTNKNIGYILQEGTHYYCADLQKVSMDEIFEAIEETIKFNMQVKQKTDLFRVKIDELGKLFEQEDYETLKTLEFKFKKKKGAPVKKKTEEKQEEVVDEPKPETIEETKPTKSTKVKDNVTAAQLEQIAEEEVL